MKISDRFYKIKKKHVIFAVVKSAVCGISLALFVTGVLLLALKLSAIALAALYYVLIGAVVALGGGTALFFLLFNPTDKQVAKRTDEEFGLNERVQTSLEYGEKSGTIVELQRADAEQKLSSLPSSKFSFAKVWKFAAVAVVALSIGVAGIAVPAKEASGNQYVDPDSTPRYVTELERAGVRELIANIEACSLSEPLKISVGGVLGQFLEELDGIDTEGKLSRAVIAAIEGSGEILTPTLSYVAIGGALNDAGQTYLGQAASGGGVYRYYALTVYDEVRTFNAVKYDAVNAKVGKGITSLRNDLTASISGGLADVLGATVSGIRQALATVEVDETDPLHILLSSFADELSAIMAGLRGGYDDTQAQNRISDTVSKFTVNASGELSTQAYNAAINVFVANRLNTIFGYNDRIQLPVADPDREDGEKDKPGSGEDGEKDPDSQSPGSGGTGETEYGSDDMVWVPGRGYMRYGDVIDEYYSLINQYLHSDELTEEQKNMIKAYYDILFGSNKNK